MFRSQRKIGGKIHCAPSNKVKEVLTMPNLNYTKRANDFKNSFFIPLETSRVHFMSRKTDTLQGTINGFTSKLINYGKEIKEKDQF